MKFTISIESFDPKCTTLQKMGGGALVVQGWCGIAEADGGMSSSHFARAMIASNVDQ